MEDLLHIVLTVLAGFLVVFGLLVLVLGWCAPGLLEGRFVRWLVTGRHLAPTHPNRQLMSMWAILFGTYLLLSASGYYTASYLAFAAWLPFAVVVFRRRIARPGGAGDRE